MAKLNVEFIESLKMIAMKRCEEKVLDAKRKRGPGKSIAWRILYDTRRDLDPEAPAWSVSGMVQEERSLLEQVSDKETELNEEYERLCREREILIERVKSEAGEQIARAKRDGEEKAREYYERQMASARGEIESLKKREEEDAKAIREAGKRNMGVAVEKIVQMVMSG